MAILLTQIQTTIDPKDKQIHRYNQFLICHCSWLSVGGVSHSTYQQSIFTLLSSSLSKVLLQLLKQYPSQSESWEESLKRAKS
jgi:hypothetical protein